MFDLPVRKGYKPQFRHETFEIVAAKKSPTYTIKDAQEEVIRRKFCKMELIRVI